MSFTVWRRIALFAASLAPFLFAFAPTAGLAAEPRGPMPIGSPGDWVTSNDYPTRALRYGEQGMVGFLLTVDPEGVPVSCKVVETSSSDVLDTQTCNLLMDRARFTPATDASGRHVEGTYRNRLRWELPEDAPIEIGPSEMIASFTIGPDGLAHDCKVDKASGSLPFPVSGPCGPSDRYVVPLGKDGRPVTRRVKLHVSIEVEEVPPAQ
ncbi:MAG: TonB family protein [Sphingomonadales bacterium]|nr:TonB family protein [Sphingomonadales bacterium]